MGCGSSQDEGSSKRKKKPTTSASARGSKKGSASRKKNGGTPAVDGANDSNGAGDFAGLDQRNNSTTKRRTPPKKEKAPLSVATPNRNPLQPAAVMEDSGNARDFGYSGTPGAAAGTAAANAQGGATPSVPVASTIAISGGRLNSESGELSPGASGRGQRSTLRPDEADGPSAHSTTLVSPTVSLALAREEANTRELIKQAEMRQFAMHQSDLAKLVAPKPNIDFTFEDDEEEEPTRRCSMNTKQTSTVKAHVEKGQLDTPDTTALLMSAARRDPHCREAVRLHDKEADCWIIVRGRIFNVTPLLETHPGGVFAVFSHAGRDATEAFEANHAPLPIAALNAFYVADVSATLN